MKLLILGLVQGTPSWSLACSYVILSIKAKLLAYPPQVCFGFVFLPNIAGKRTLISSYLQMYYLTCPWNNYLKFFSSPGHCKLLLFCYRSSCLLVTPMTVFLPNSGRQSNNYMSKMPVLLLSSRIRIQTKALESGAPW